MSDPLPKQTAWLFRGFRKYCIRVARKRFHAVRLSKSSSPLPRDGAPVLIVMNHPGWWDPILAAILSCEFKAYQHFGAIDAVALQKYAVLKRLGFVPVDRSSLRGAATFLSTGELILNHPRTAFWITAQGEFADVRQRPLSLQSGVGHLAARMTTGYILPIAFEYCFWNESKPEALIRIGDAISVAEQGTLPPHNGLHGGLTPPAQQKTITGKEWTGLIEDALTKTLDVLNVEVISRDVTKFTSLVAGRSGLGGLYDFARRMKAILTGKKFNASHGGEHA